MLWRQDYSFFCLQIWRKRGLLCAMVATLDVQLFTSNICPYPKARICIFARSKKYFVETK